MASAGTLSLALIVIGPWIWRQYAERKRGQTDHKHARSNSAGQQQNLGRIPMPLSKPSNTLVLTASIVLVTYHTCALLLTSRTAMQTDLFLLLGRSINTPASVLRADVQTFPRFTFGWKASWTEQGLDTLLRRLSSWDGRKLHLLIGIDPLVSCSFCDSAKDYIYYSLATRLAQYGFDMFLLGIVTMRFDALNTLDDVVILIVQSLLGKQTPLTPEPNSLRLRPHRYQWRARVKFIFAAFAVCELAVLTGLYDFGVRQGRMSHWYANRNVAWHTVMLVLSALTLVCPAQPHVPAMLEIVHSLEQQQHITHDIRANLQAANLTQQILWQEPTLRDRVHQFTQQPQQQQHDIDELDDDDKRRRRQRRLSSPTPSATFIVHPDDTDAAVVRLTEHAVAARVDVNVLRQQARQAAHGIWHNSQSIWHHAQGPGQREREPERERPSR